MATNYVVLKLEKPVLIRSTRAKWTVRWQAADGSLKFEYFPTKKQAIAYAKPFVDDQGNGTSVILPESPK